MARYAPTCPPQILRGLRDDGVMGDYHLLLAHDVVKRPSEYAELFGCYTAHQTVILDNSVMELGGAAALPSVIEAVKVVEPDVVVLPDVYGHGPDTTQSIGTHIGTWRTAIDSYRSLSMDPIQLMMVPQGRTYEEWVQCCVDLSNLAAAEYPNDIFWWGVPRIFKDRLNLPRITAVNWMHNLQPTWRIHLLGFSEDIEDDFRTAASPHVSGIDSAVPMRAASLNIPFTLTTKLPPRSDWWDTCTYIPGMVDNVKKVRQLLA